MHKIRMLMSAVLATSIVFAFSVSFGQQAQEGQEVPEDQGLQERQQLLTPLPMFVNGIPVEEFIADEAQVREALENLQGIAALSDEELVRRLLAIEAGDVTRDEVPEELRGISGLLTQFMLRSWLLKEYYLFAGKIRDYMYIDEDKDGKSGSGHLAVDMKYWRYDSIIKFRAGLPPDKVELLHWHIEVDGIYNVYQRQNVYDEPFPQINLALPQEAIDRIWHPARDLKWKLHARGERIIIRQVYRKVDDNPIELLPPTDPVYDSTDETCIDILFNPYPPELELPPTPPAHSSPVLDWNELLLAAVRQGPARPTVIARSLYIVHAAMYNAWAAYDAVALPVNPGGNLRRPTGEHTGANKAEAVSYAAYHAAVTQFPTQRPSFDALMHELGYDPAGATMKPTTAAGIGTCAAQRVLAYHANDGSNAAHGFTDTTGYRPVNSADPTAGDALGGLDFDPNRWQPLRVPTGRVRDVGGRAVIDPTDPLSYADQAFLTPHWGALRPFALKSGDQFRPPPPPRKGDPSPYVDATGRLTTNNRAWLDQFREIIDLSAGLTDRQKAVVEFWADGPRTETPPGHWNQLAQGFSLRDEHTLDKDVRFFFVLNGALLDASIAAWDAKRAYDFVRPVSAIRHEWADVNVQAWGGPNRGARSIKGRDWQPYQLPIFPTPPFPEYVSGHSTYSAAAAMAIALFTGSDRFYDGRTRIDLDLDGDGERDLLGRYTAHRLQFEGSLTRPVVLWWPTVWDAANEAGLSRRYGGIHIQDGDLRGRDLGKVIGALAFHHAEKLINGDRSALLAPERAGISLAWRFPDCLDFVR